MQFIARGQLVLEAHDIDDAMGKIAQHFAFMVSEGEETAVPGEWKMCAVCGDDWRASDVEMLDGTDFEIEPEPEVH